MENAVYVGAGMDIRPILMFKNIKKFIYIDSRPKSEYGLIGYNQKDYYSKNFLVNIFRIFAHHKFTLYSMLDNCLEYKKGDQTVKYYINTSFPEMLNDELIDEISCAKYLILIGHDPHNKILEYVLKPLTLIIDNKTCFYYDIDEENSTINKLLENNKIVEEVKIIEYDDDFEWWMEETLYNFESKYNIIENYTIRDLIWYKQGQMYN